MPSRFCRPVLVVATLVASAGGASAQGYTVRTWGYYDPVPFPPLTGGTYSYTIGGRPMVTLQDPWGRIIDMPLQPKVLYYDTPFLTPQGWYRPISIAVIPDARPRTFVPGPRQTELIPPAANAMVPAPAARSTVLPDVKSNGPIPTVPVNPPRPEPPGPGLPPPVPKVPELPTVPKVPGTVAGPAVPKLGLAPADALPIPKK
jgi:hypothetical protein